MSSRHDLLRSRIEGQYNFAPFMFMRRIYLNRRLIRSESVTQEQVNRMSAYELLKLIEANGVY